MSDSGGKWIEVEADRLLYVQHGRDNIICDRFCGRVTVLVKLTDKSAEKLRKELQPI